MLFSLVLKVHFSISSTRKSPSSPTGHWHCPATANMTFKTVCLTLLSAIFAAFISTQLLPNPPCIKNFINLAFTSFSPSIISTLSIYNILDHHQHNHHHHHHGPKGPQSGSLICDDFPPDFPPPDTNTTSNLCVDRNGCCNFTTVQSAIDAAGVSSQKRTIIWMTAGIYFEKVMVPRTKPNITLQGQGMEFTAIVWNDTANSSHGTFFSASIQVFSANFIAKNISFMNVAPIANPGDVGGQAVAMRIAGDQAAFWGCGFFGSQDTLHDDRGRHYFRDCFIQGSIDFVFGNGRSLYENCQLISIANPVPTGSTTITGVVTAHARASASENTGFVFVNCSIGGTGRIWLGRAWRPFSRVIFAYTYMTEIISPDGWNDYNDPTRDQSVFYGEYNCIGGGANQTMRAPYAQRLNETQVSQFLNVSYIDGDQWLQPYV